MVNFAEKAFSLLHLYFLCSLQAGRSQSVSTHKRWLPEGYTQTFGRGLRQLNYRSVEKPSEPPQLPKEGAITSGKYRNMFEEYGYTAKEIEKRVDDIFQQLFFGNHSEEAVYFEDTSTTAYIMDIGDNDVRSEGMSYGMMISVQRNNQTMFKMLWNWAKKYMRHNDPSDDRYGYFAWHCSSKGNVLDPNPASDGETYFATALYMASYRWKSAEYYNDANDILSACLSKTTKNNQGGGVSNMFINNTGVENSMNQVVFVPYGSSSKFTDPSYHLPSFYQSWYRAYHHENEFASATKAFWLDLTQSARNYFHLTSSDKNHWLAPDYSNFDGSPTGSGINAKFAFDAWRVAMNIAMDYSWHKVDEWQVKYCNGLQAFFKAQNATSPYGNQYDLPSGKPSSQDHSPGLVAMNAVCSLASNASIAWDFVQELWNTPTPSGKWRYYDGMLYMMGMMNVAGQYRYYGASGNTTLGYCGKNSPANACGRCYTDADCARNMSSRRDQKFCASVKDPTCQHPNPPSPGPSTSPQPAPSPSPRAPPSNSSNEFERNGRCLSWDGQKSQISFGGCYIHKTDDTSNLWNLTKVDQEYLVYKEMGTQKVFVGSTACSANEVLVPLSKNDTTGKLSWDSTVKQLRLIGCSSAICIGDEGGIITMACSDSRSKGWSIRSYGYQGENN